MMEEMGVRYPDSFQDLPNIYFLNSIQSPIISQKYLFIVANFILRFHSTNPLKKFRTIKITQLIKIATLIALLPPPSSGTKDKRGASVPLEEYREERKAAGNGFGETEREDPYFFLTPVLG